jgi:hypothetical protein
MLLGIRIVPKNRRMEFDKMSRIDFSRMYTVEHLVKVLDFGRVHPSHCGRLKAQWMETITYSTAETITAEADVSNQSKDSSDLEEDNLKKTRIDNDSGKPSLGSRAPGRGGKQGDFNKSYDSGDETDNSFVEMRPNRAKKAILLPSHSESGNDQRGVKADGGGRDDSHNEIPKLASNEPGPILPTRVRQNIYTTLANVGANLERSDHVVAKPVSAKLPPPPSIPLSTYLAEHDDPFFVEPYSPPSSQFVGQAKIQTSPLPSSVTEGHFQLATCEASDTSVTFKNTSDKAVELVFRQHCIGNSELITPKVPQIRSRLEDTLEPTTSAVIQANTATDEKVQPTAQIISTMGTNLEHYPQILAQESVNDGTARNKKTIPRLVPNIFEDVLDPPTSDLFQASTVSDGKVKSMADAMSPSDPNLELHATASAPEQLEDDAPMDRTLVPTFALDINHYVTFAAGFAIALCCPSLILALGIGLILYSTIVVPTTATENHVHTADSGDDARQKTTYPHNKRAVSSTETYYRDDEIGEHGVQPAANGVNQGADLLDDDFSRNERLVDPGEWKAKWDNLEDSIVQTSSISQFIAETRDAMTGSFAYFNSLRSQLFDISRPFQFPTHYALTQFRCAGTLSTAHTFN